MKSKQFSLPLNIFAVSDILAMGALEAVLERGLIPGKDVNIVGFDDLRWSKKLGLTTVRQPIMQMGKKAANLLLKRIAGESFPRREIRFKPKLMIRRSTGGG